MVRMERLAATFLAAALVFAVATVPLPIRVTHITHCIQVYRWTLRDGFSVGTLIEGASWNYNHPVLEIRNGNVLVAAFTDSLSVRDHGTSCE